MRKSPISSCSSCGMNTCLSSLAQAAEPTAATPSVAAEAISKVRRFISTFPGLAEEPIGCAYGQRGGGQARVGGRAAGIGGGAYHHQIAHPVVQHLCIHHRAVIACTHAQGALHMGF